MSDIADTIVTRGESEGSKNKNISAGIHDGWNLGLDPLGAVFTYLTGIKTNGSEGHRAGDVSNKVNFEYDSQSSQYKGCKVFGTALGLGVNVLLVGFPQLVEVGSNAVNYSKLNRSSN